MTATNGHPRWLAADGQLAEGYSLDADGAIHGPDDNVYLPNVSAPPPTATEPASGPAVRATTPAWPEPPALAARHGLPGAIVEAIEPHTESDPAAVLAQTLASMGNAMGRSPGYPVEGTVHATNMFLAVVGESAVARKGTGYSRSAQVLRLAEPAWAKHNIASGLSSGEGVIWKVRDAVVKRREAGLDDADRADPDGFVEDVVEDGVPDKRLLIVEPEFASVLRQGKRDGNTLSAILRQFWDSGDVDSLTKNSPARTTGAHVSIIGHITAGELRRELGQVEVTNGFANRFLWVCSRRSQSLPDGGEGLTEDVLQPLANDLAASLAFARRLDEPLRRTPAARDLWHAVYEDLMTVPPGALGYVTSRAVAQVLRLSMIYALADRTAAIDVPHLEAALALWDYCQRSARYIWSDRSDDQLAERIYDALVEAGTAGMAREQIRKLVGGKVTGDRIDAAMATLDGGRRAYMTKVGTGGRPADRWYAVLTSTPSVPSTNGSA